MCIGKSTANANDPKITKQNSQNMSRESYNN